MGGKFHPKLNIRKRPIENKYYEGKVKRTLKRELKVPEIAEREAVERESTVTNSAHIAGKRCRTERSTTLAELGTACRYRTTRSLSEVIQIAR